MSEEQLEAKMKKILEDYAPILNAKQIEGEALEGTESSPSSSHKKEESSSDPQKLKSHHHPDHKTQTT